MQNMKTHTHAHESYAGVIEEKYVVECVKRHLTLKTHRFHSNAQNADMHFARDPALVVKKPLRMMRKPA